MLVGVCLDQRRSSSTSKSAKGMQKMRIVKPLVRSTALLSLSNNLCPLLVLNLQNGTCPHFTWFINKSSNVSVGGGRGLTVVTWKSFLIYQYLQGKLYTNFGQLTWYLLLIKFRGAEGRMDWVKRHFVFAILDNKNGFINLRFMHKLYWMKTEWDQARFCGLV